MGCPRCQHENPPRAKFCSECGERLAAGAEAREVSPETYTPRHLAERILTSRAALQGERKQVTVLFADLRGSMELLADRDPEEARRLLDPVLERMMEAVHRYDGTVNQVMGDGVMALFGAPLALEDHALRACYAALRMQAAVAEVARDFRRRLGIPVEIRVGLNSGEVVVRSIGNDLRMDYSAVGESVHLAARMEQLAAPGHTLLTGHTQRLVDGFVTLVPLGAVPVKGLAEPVPAFELTGTGPVSTRLQAAAARGLTPFVGRDTEMARLREARDLAAAGRGQVVSIVGQPGTGKSRLVWEFTRSALPAAWRVLAAGALSHDQRSPYLPVVGLLRAHFGIEDGDDRRSVRTRILTRLLDVDASLGVALPALLTLLDATDDDAPPAWLDPAERRRQTVEAVVTVLLREARARPLGLVVEDLQWADAETQAVLDALVDGLDTARVLLVVTCRPEYRHAWSGLRHHREIRVEALPRASAEQVLRSLLGDAPDLGPLAALLVERTGGNAFFLEESVRDLAETGTLAGARGAYRLTRPVASIRVPATVQAVLAARIDRLAPAEKALLETAAVVGREVPLALLEGLEPLPPGDLGPTLTRLCAAELLAEARLFPQPAYAFRHALTLEVAYAGLLQERRRTLHARIVDALERLHPDRLAEHAETLARHAVRGELWDRAVDHLRRVAARAYARGALPETVERYEQALGILSRLPETPDNARRALDVRLDLHGPLMVLGQVSRLGEVGEEAERLARRLGDRPRLGRALYELGYHCWLSARYRRSLEHAGQVLDLAAALDDPALRVRTTHLLGLNRVALGEYAAAAALLAGVVDGPDAELARGRLGLLMSYVDACGWLAFCLAATGAFAEAGAYADRAVRLADARDHPQAQALAYGFRAIPLVVQGDFSLALPWCERARHVCETRAVRAWLPTVDSFRGLVLAWLGHHADGVRHLERALVERERLSVRTNLPHFHLRLAEGLLLAGRTAEARQAAGRGLELAVETGEAGARATALHLLGEIAAAAGPPAAEAAVAHLEGAAALARTLGMRPLLGRCHLGLGRLLAAGGRPAGAVAALSAAAGLFGAMNMGAWLGRARQALDALPHRSPVRP